MKKKKKEEKKFRKTQSNDHRVVTRGQKRGGGLTLVIQIYFDKGCRLVFMSSPNADMIAVSLACPKDPKSPYKIEKRKGEV